MKEMKNANSLILSLFKLFIFTIELKSKYEADELDFCRFFNFKIRCIDQS